MRVGRPSGVGAEMGPENETLAENLAERHKHLMLEREREAFNAAQSGDKARQSIASTESERHRAVYHAMCLVVADQAKREMIPRAENCGRYLAEGNDGQWYYLNHANTWQGYQGPSFQEDPICWLPTETVKWLEEYEGPACATQTAAHNRPIKSDGGVPVYLGGSIARAEGRSE